MGAQPPPAPINGKYYMVEMYSGTSSTTCFYGPDTICEQGANIINAGGWDTCGDIWPPNEFFRRYIYLSGPYDSFECS